jgi:Tol biopolymer transport system component
MSSKLAVRVTLAGAVSLVALIAAASSAKATYPGKTNGRLAFAITSDGNTDVYSALPSGRAVRRLTEDPGFDACPAYSADGESIAWCGPGGVWLMNQDGADKRQLTAFGTFPDFSPDGNKIVFNGAPSGSTNVDVWVIDLTGSNLTRLTTAPGPDRFPVWSPDGTKIAFQSMRTGIAQVWVMDPDGSTQTQLTFDPVPKDQLPDWSPDGSRIAFVEQTHPTGGEIWVMNADGSDAHILMAGADKLGTAWSPDGKRSRRSTGPPEPSRSPTSTAPTRAQFIPAGSSSFRAGNPAEPDSTTRTSLRRPPRRKTSSWARRFRRPSKRRIRAIRSSCLRAAITGR